MQPTQLITSVQGTLLLNAPGSELHIVVIMVVIMVVITPTHLTHAQLAAAQLCAVLARVLKTQPGEPARQELRAVANCTLPRDLEFCFCQQPAATAAAEAAAAQQWRCLRARAGRSLSTAEVERAGIAPFWPTLVRTSLYAKAKWPSFIHWN